jgi:hypothetical protein
VPRAGHRGATSGWLESIMKIVELKRRFGASADLPQVVRFVGSLKTDGGYGDKPDLWDTCLCLSILALLGENAAAGDTRAFVDRLQVPSFGFTLTCDSLIGNLDIIYAGLQCCRLLGASVSYPRDTLAFVLACQTAKGGFSRAPNALPDVELTHRALQIMAMLEPAALTRAGGPARVDRRLIPNAA